LIERGPSAGKPPQSSSRRETSTATAERALALATGSHAPGTTRRAATTPAAIHTPAHQRQMIRRATFGGCRPWILRRSPPASGLYQAFQCVTSVAGTRLAGLKSVALV